MKLTLGIIIGVFLFTSVSAQTKAPTINDLKWLAGCWEINHPDEKVLISEQWMLPAADGMLGMSRTIRNDKMSAYELMRIIQKETEIFYIVRPSSKKDDVTFKLVEWKANEISFEREGDEFPSKITYKLVKKDSLTAYLTGRLRRRTMIEYPYKRIKCPK